MDTLRPAFIAAIGVSGTFWEGFAEVLSKAAIPTTPAEFGKALASLVLLLVPVAVQWAVRKWLSPPQAEETLELLHDVVAHQVALHAASHPPPAESSGPPQNVLQPTLPLLDAANSIS